MTTATHRYEDWGIVGVDASRSGEQRVICPRCTPKRKPEHQREKDLSVNAQDGAFHCQHCEAGGRLDRGWYDDPAPDDERLPRKTYKPPRPLKPQTSQDPLSEWLTARGIDPSVGKAAGLTLVTSWCPQCGEDRGAIAIPYYKDGRHTGTKYRDRDKHFWRDKDTERHFYGYDELIALPDGGTVIVVEGEVDRLSLMAAGITVVVSVPDGAPNPDAKTFASKFSFLDDPRVLSAFDRAGKIILATDADAPGEALARELLSRSPHPERVYTVTWPDGVKDANDCLRLIGADELRRCINSAEPAPVEGIITSDMFDRDILRFYDEGLPVGKSTGWNVLDTYLRILLGEFWVVHGRTGQGKSSWVNALLVNLSRLYGMRFAICSPEWVPIALHGVALMETHIGKPLDRKRYGDAAMDRDELEQARSWLMSAGTFIDPKHKDVATVIERFKAARFRRGCEVFIVDPWTELEHRHERGEDKLDYIDRSISDLQDFGRDYGALVILVAHQPKPMRDKDRDGKIRYLDAGVYGAANAAAFANKADHVIEYSWPDPDSNEAIIHVEKVRKRFLGRPGTASLWFDRTTGRFRETEQVQRPSWEQRAGIA